MKYRLSVELPVSIERAFEFSIDSPHGAAYHGTGTTITKVTEGDIGLGTVFRYERPGRPQWLLEVTGLEPPRWCETTLRIGDDPPQVGRMTFAERDGGDGHHDRGGLRAVAVAAGLGASRVHAGSARSDVPDVVACSPGR